MTEESPESNLTRVVIRPGGAVAIEGAFELQTEEETAREFSRALFCRCGESSRKPFCDESHNSCSFSDPGSFTNGVFADTLPTSSEESVVIRAVEKGPLIVEGPVVIVDANGEERHSPGRFMLCRCGASNSKPFCDGRHGDADCFDDNDS